MRPWILGTSAYENDDGIEEESKPTSSVRTQTKQIKSKHQNTQQIMPSSTEDHFNKDLKDVHLIYDYDAQDADGNPQKWRYEAWFYSFNRIVYAIHGGPMAGRKNYQTAEYQCKFLEKKKNPARKIKCSSKP